MDGVPGLSFMGIAPGETLSLPLQGEPGRHLLVSRHSRFQEQVGLYGPIVIEPRDGDGFAADREHVVLLSDWTDADPEHIYATLKKQSNYYNFGKRTAGDFLRDARAHGVGATLATARCGAAMRMNPTDLADVSALRLYVSDERRDAGRATGPELFARGENVRLRFINGSSMTFFDVRIPGLKMTVVAADGQDIEPVTVDEFRIAPAETYDVIVEPADDRAYTIFAQSMDRSGYARGTLAPRDGHGSADVPALDPRQLLTMSDMMGDMAHGAMGAWPVHARRTTLPCRGMAHGTAPATHHARPNTVPASTCASTRRARPRRSRRRPARQRPPRAHLRRSAHDRPRRSRPRPAARSNCI